MELEDLAQREDLKVEQEAKNNITEIEKLLYPSKIPKREKSKWFKLISRSWGITDSEYLLKNFKKQLEEFESK